MYKRNEVIEEEHLEWNKKTKAIIQEENLKVTLSPDVKSENILINKESSFEHKLYKQSNVMTFIYKYEYLSLGLIILILPYLVGVLFNFVLFYMYSGVTLDKVFIIEKEHKILELWTIGVYAFVTSWIIWIIFKTLSDSR